MRVLGQNRFLLFTTLISGVLVLLTVSCDKHHVKKLAGIYECQVNYQNWTMTPTFEDSTYNEQLIVTRNGKILRVLDCDIHIDSLWEGRSYYIGYVHNYLSVQFRNDSIYLTRSSGGLGGNITYTCRGRKFNS